MRHAKSSWEKANLSDFDRPLNSRGKRDAPIMGKFLQEQNLKPQKIYSSPANRAITTAKIIAKEVHFNDSIIEMPSFYHASQEQLLQEINKFDNEAKRVFMFGHNPGFTYLAEYLTNQNFGNIPTSGIVGIQFPFDRWEMISGNTGELLLYEFPKNLL
jgi:phosphohistidine phosphatase